MKQFHYKAYDEEGGIHEGSLAARTKREAAAALFSEGLSVIRLFEEKEAHRFFRARPFASRRSLSLLASSWAALLSAGLTGRSRSRSSRRKKDRRREGSSSLRESGSRAGILCRRVLRRAAGVRLFLFLCWKWEK